ncbi:protein required for establishment and maintenance of sister chromatid condensation and cohesion [Brettanomyces bruxellensis AWRI1499]|nr:protein required for establishment and maintenance of sister chromatid condensation and cohesion [Brettanomyces bruxellensis AWRI1499]
MSAEENTDEKAQAFYNLSAFASAYLIFAVEIISTEDNISLLFYLTQRVKQYQSVSLDVESEGLDRQQSDFKNEDERLYFVSDLAQLVVKQISEMRKWYTTTWPGKMALPSDLYQKNRSKESVQDVVKSSFIPEQYLAEVTRVVKTSCKRFKSLPKNLTMGKRVRQDKDECQRKVSILEIDAQEVAKDKRPFNRRDTIATRVLRRSTE